MADDDVPPRGNGGDIEEIDDDTANNEDEAPNGTTGFVADTSGDTVSDTTGVVAVTSGPIVSDTTGVVAGGLLRRLCALFRRVPPGEVSGDLEQNLIGVHPPNNNNSDEWNDFMNTANDFIQWMISNVFLFVPVKFFLTADRTSSSNEQLISSIKDLLLELISSLPEMFLPTVVLYTGFFLGGRAFRNPKIRFVFELSSLFCGVAAALEALLFAAEPGLWWWTAGAVAFYAVVLAGTKICDCFC